METLSKPSRYHDSRGGIAEPRVTTTTRGSPGSPFHPPRGGVGPLNSTIERKEHGPPNAGTHLPMGDPKCGPRGGIPMGGGPGWGMPGGGRGGGWPPEPGGPG